MLCCLIMAGGKGERFWPASSEEKPKQFLNINRSKKQFHNGRQKKDNINEYRRFIYN